MSEEETKAAVTASEVEGAAASSEGGDASTSLGRTRESGEPRLTAGMTLARDDEQDDSAYKITIPHFHGPLDLLLHLIRKHEIDIYDIPIVPITEQYNAYLEAMTELDLDIAADYIYMAALLINIKSRMLLPRDESTEGDAGDDPRRELVDRLLEYQRFKAVAESFAELDVARMGMWTRPRVPPPGAEEQTDVDMTDVGLFDLIDAFRTALVRYRQNHPQAIELHRVVHKVSDKMREIYSKLAEKGPIRLQWFLEGRDRNELIAVFLGMLELVRLGGIALQQGEIFGEILMNRTEQEIAEDTFALFDNS
ncbi:MAG TPA: segregation/condensation protein A [Thermoanaerobaculia bacterium]|nr:segregation/condensation protein A [Thermoanaerobaculia bacterium]